MRYYHGRLEVYLIVMAVCAIAAIIRIAWIKRGHIVRSLTSRKQTLYVTVHDLFAGNHDEGQPDAQPVYIYAAAFKRKDGRIIYLDVSEQDYLRLEKGAQGRLIFQGTWLRSFQEGAEESFPPVKPTLAERIAGWKNEQRLKNDAEYRARMQPEPDRPMQLDRIKPAQDKADSGVLTHELDE